MNTEQAVKQVTDEKVIRVAAGLGENELFLIEKGVQAGWMVTPDTVIEMVQKIRDLRNEVVELNGYLNSIEN